MEIRKNKMREYGKRISIARMRILTQNGFFGVIVMHLKPSLDDKIETVSTDGVRIFFNPSFLDRLSDDDLLYILLHEVMHIALRHIFRIGDRDKTIYDTACDIVVNSNILHAAGMDLSSITLSGYGVAMHTAPDGSEGYKYTAEEVYEMLQASMTTGTSSQIGSGSGGNSASGNGSGDSDGSDSGDDDGSGGSGSGDGDGDGDGSGDGDGIGKGSGSGNNGGGGPGGGGYGFCDDHSKWGSSSDKALEANWNNWIMEAYESGKSRGTVPLGAERVLKDLMDPKVDWRTILNDFIQEEVTDYSFMPPDRRFSDSPFFLPDFNDTETTVKDILFMVDTSGSMSDEDITQAYSEIKGAIDQFNGRLEGWLGFFDAEVVPPQPFTDEDEFEVIRPEGGGGTDFGIIFDYVRDDMADREITSIIIMTDGYAPYPDESASRGIPVLWMINNDDEVVEINNDDEVVEPPWGKTVRF